MCIRDRFRRYRTRELVLCFVPARVTRIRLLVLFRPLASRLLMSGLLRTRLLLARRLLVSGLLRTRLLLARRLLLMIRLLLLMRGLLRTRLLRTRPQQA